MRKTFLIAGAILTLVMAVALITNPTKQQYIGWAKEQVIQESGQGFTGVLASMMAPTILDGTTRADNYYLFSVYKTKIADKEITTVGIFDKFVLVGE